MAKEIARFQLTSGNNNLERWLIDDDANLIFDNVDSTKYVSVSSKNYYSSAFFNFPSSIYGYLFSSGFLLCDKATRVYRQRSTDSGTTWSDYSQTNAMVSTYGTLYTMPSHDTNVGGTYVINLICNDAQCISSTAPLFTVASEYNTYISSTYVPPYTWTPVSSVYGKLGNIDLSKILTINDGEPKSGTSSDVKLTTISLVKTLINRIVVDEDEVAVEYQVVDDNFEYIKLVYKQDSEPISVDDGTAIDLDPDESIIGISGICDGNVYYFKIFTNINESEAYEFRTAVIKPRDTIIELLKNGTLLNSNSLVPDPYLSASNLETATSSLTSSGYEIVADYTQTTYAPSFYTILTQNNTPTTTGRTYKPLLATNSQDARFKFYDYFKIKFDMQINIPATDSGFAIRPVIYSNDSYEYLAIYVNPGDTYIRSDPNSDISINLQNVETDWISYFDYVAGNYNTQPNLEFQLSFLKKAPFYFKLTIKEIQVKLNELFLPQCIPDVNVRIKTSSSSQSWKIKEVYQNVVQLGYNSFLLQPTSGTGTTTVYYVIPFNLTARDDLYVARDYYVKNASGYAAFGIETTDNLSGLPIYDANGDTVNKALIRREGTTTSFSNTLNKEDHTYLYKQVTSSSSRQGFIFYTDACKKLHINNKVVL